LKEGTQAAHNGLTTISTAPHPRLPARRGLVAVACGLGAGANSAEAGSAYRRGGGAGDPPLDVGQMSLRWVKEP